MKLLNDFYRIDSRMADCGDTLFGISLLPDFCAYEGHFPGNPVSPGVCSMQMIKECAELLSERRLFLAHIAKCRFSAVITPHTTPHLQLHMQLSAVIPQRFQPDEEAAADRTGAERTAEECVKAETAYHVCATLFDDTTIYIQFKGELTTVR
jgi:3-hydroxyacyl-[acyl-carrier-protein] dehydratase